MRTSEVYSVNIRKIYFYNLLGGFSIREHINWWVIYVNYSKKPGVLALVNTVIWQDRV